MKRTIIYCGILLISISCFLTACNSEPEKTNEQGAKTEETLTETTPITPADSAKAKADSTAATKPPEISAEMAAAISWMGVYTGLYPCDKCKGIDTRLKLMRDYHFVITRKHRGPHDPVEHADKGEFTWNSTGTILTLESYSHAPTLKFVFTEKKLTQLDENGKKYTGKLEGRYILTK